MSKVYDFSSMETKEKHDIELHSEEVQDVMGSVPPLDIKVGHHRNRHRSVRNACRNISVLLPRDTFRADYHTKP